MDNQHLIKRFIRLFLIGTLTVLIGCTLFVNDVRIAGLLLLGTGFIVNLFAILQFMLRLFSKRENAPSSD